MSNRALTWAFDSGLPSGPRFVLVALADAGTDHSGEDWTCYPSIRRLIDMTGQGRSTIERHISWLWREGWISRDPRRRPDGRLGINDYTLHRSPERRAELRRMRAAPGSEAARDDGAPSLDLRDGPSLDPAATIPQIGDAPPLDLRAQEPLGEPSDEPSTRAREPGDDGFEDAIAVWPESGRKRTRWPAGRAAWAWACGIETAARLQLAVVACAADPDMAKGDFGWPAFDTWLIEERWRAFLPKPEPAVVAGPPRTEFAGPLDLRADIVAYRGETFARLHLDRCRWDADAHTLTAGDEGAFGALRAAVGHIISRHGAQLAPPATPEDRCERHA